MRKALKRAALALALLFAAAQFYRPARTNPPVDEGRTLRANAHVTPEVAAILERSCNDCHSSETRWPWYSNVSPVSWYLKRHVEEGRRELSFSEWGGYTPRRRERKLHEICRQVESGEMPLNPYCRRPPPRGPPTETGRAPAGGSGGGGGASTRRRPNGNLTESAGQAGPGECL